MILVERNRKEDPRGDLLSHSHPWGSRRLYICAYTHVGAIRAECGADLKA